MPQEIIEPSTTPTPSSGPTSASNTALNTAHLTPHTALVPAINAWKIYLDDQGSSPHTLKAFLGDVRLFAKYLPPDHMLGKVSTNEINLFLEWLQNGRGVPCSPKTLARRITSIKAFFRWLHKGGILLVDPAEKVVQRSVLSPLPEVLSPAELDLALQAADRLRSAEKPDTRHAALFQLLIYTGIKKSECLNLTPNHLDFLAPEGPILFVRYPSPAHRYKERKITFPTDWQTVYEEYLAQYPTDDRLFPWSMRRLEYLLEDITNEAGLHKHISFAMCRWTCALLDLRAGIDPDKIRQKLGISKIQWREIYNKLSQLDEQTPREEIA
ncbi:MAG: site-specific integrase [Anaerolineales bacterium]|nr:site-specific integrase [Anaerolineales bacterium]